MLSPYRVLDLTDERGMLCAQILADLGADVIAVEPPGGSPARRIAPFRGTDGSLFWQAYARGKRGITLDLTTAAGQQQFRRLAESADFVIESFTPGYLDGLGIGYRALQAVNPGLILVSITPFGQQGPKATWPATDLTAWAASGVLFITGDDDRPPVQVPGKQAYLHAGAEGAVGALIALAARERDGLGQHVDVSMQAAAMMATQSFILQSGWETGTTTRVSGGAKVGPLRAQFIYPCKDGHVSITFLFGAIIGPFTRRLFEWMHEEGFVDDATRDKDWVSYVVLVLTGKEPQSELVRCIKAIERFTLTKTKAELFAEALRRGLLLVPVNTVADVARSEQLADRGYFTPVEEREPGDVRYPGPFARFSATPIRYRRRAPRPGEHDAEVLAAPRAPRPLPRTPNSALPLAGLKVLDFTWVIATPFGIRYLAEYGATVVHVESGTRPDALRGYNPFKDGQPGAERSGQYANTMAGKLGLSLNLSVPEAVAVAQRLVQWADVVVEAYSPRAMRRWGLHYEALRELNPSLIMMSSCLNGQTGPQSFLAGFGTMGAQLAGFGHITGWPDRPPAGPFVAYTDYVSPKYVAASLLAALDHRRRTGEGQYIDFSQAEASLHFLAPTVLDYLVNGHVQGRAGNFSAEHAPHGVYPVRVDGGEETEFSDRWVAIACGTEEQWRRLCVAAGHADWQSDPRFANFAARQANGDALDAAIATWTAGRDAFTVEQTLQAAGVPVHRATTSADALADPQLRFRGHFVEVDHPEVGRVPIEHSRLRLSRTPAPVPAPGPLLGQHNDHILRDILGMGDEEIVELTLSGALE